MFDRPYSVRLGRYSGHQDYSQDKRDSEGASEPSISLVIITDSLNSSMRRL